MRRSFIFCCLNLLSVAVFSGDCNKGREQLAAVLSVRVSQLASRKTTYPEACISRRFSSLMMVPPPVDTMRGGQCNTSCRNRVSRRRKSPSPCRVNISVMVNPVCFSMYSSRSMKGFCSMLASSLPTDDFPEPINPVRMRCCSMFISDGARISSREWEKLS